MFCHTGVTEVLKSSLGFTRFGDLPTFTMPDELSEVPKQESRQILRVGGLTCESKDL